MKYNVKRFVIIMVCIIFGSFLISGILFYTTGGVRTASAVTGQISTNKVFNTAGISKIVINTVSTDVKIIPAEDKNITVDFYGNITSNLAKNNPRLNADINNGILNISIIYPRTITLGFFNISRLYLDVYIPDSFLKDLEVTTVSGDINAKGFTGENIQIKSTSGELAADMISVKTLVLESISGDIVLKNTESETNSIHTISGEVNVSFKSILDTLKINTTSGDVQLFLPDNSQFSFNLGSISGDIKNNFDSKISFADERNLKGSVGKSAFDISVNTTSGEIMIEKE